MKIDIESLALMIFYISGDIMITLFLKSLIIGYSGAVMPGSIFTYTVDKSLRNGAMSGLLVSLGHAFLELF